jgi:hypothetical protein
MMIHGRRRALGFRFVIYTADHEPAHIHVTGPGRDWRRIHG